MRRFFVLACGTVLLSAAALAAPVDVPFVGCPSDGQMGPQPAPEGAPVARDLDAETAAKLAFYSAEGDDGILAPRGWHCVSLYGSSGAFLLVSPHPITPDDVLSRITATYPGPLVQLSVNLGGTSGRWTVARLLARYFPERAAFVQSVVALDRSLGLDRQAYPTGPSPGETVLRRDKDWIETETKPGMQGLGTYSRLQPDGDPIYGAAKVLEYTDDDTLDVQNIAVRLPPADSALTNAIVREFESRPKKKN